jgi:hypothetical protein
MNLVASRRVLAIWMIAALCFSLALIRMQRNTSPDEMNDKDMASKMMTACVGRFLIDLPEGTELRFSPSRIAGVTITAQPGYSEEQFRTVIEQREKTLASERNEYGSTSLEKKLVVEALNMPFTLFYFNRTKPLTLIEFGESVPGTEQGITVEALGIKDGVLYRFFADDVASPRSEENVLDLVKKFEALDSTGVPRQPGFCVDGGLVHDPIGPEHNETIAMFASLKGHPDVAIRLDTSVNVSRLDEPLLVRESKNEVKKLYASNFRTLRGGERVLGGTRGEEVLDRVKELNGTIGHSFMWIGIGKLSDVLTPKVTLELITGKGRAGNPRSSSLSDEEALQIWDVVSSSLRLRPTSLDSVDVSDKELMRPLGELSVTDAICPQTGYWQCEATGQKSFLKKTDRVPHGTLQTPPSLWQRLIGRRPVHHIPATWKLIAYDTAPKRKAYESDKDGEDIADSTDRGQPVDGAASASDMIDQASRRG